MYVDDRLATVLRQTAGGEAIARIQYRQLLDLLGTLPADAGGPQVDAAYLKLAELSARIAPGERALMLREPVARLRSPRLIAELAGGEPLVVAAAIARADLAETQWLDLIPALPGNARSLLRQRRGLPDRVQALLHRLGVHAGALPPAAGAQVAASTDALPTDPQPIAASPGATIHPLRPRFEVPANEPAPSQGIRAIVRRIEEFRRVRQETDAAHAAREAPRLPFDEADEAQRLAPVRGFDFLTGADGTINWAEAIVAPMIVGLPLTPRDGGPGRARLATAMRSRLPVHDVRLVLPGAPAISGDWQVDAVPVFAGDGRFSGYRGRMRRADPVGPASSEGGAEADRMRQVLHELRTPITGIQAAAETMQQAFFGPINQEYRACAATILGDTARIQAAFDELERLVKLGNGALSLGGAASDLATIVQRTVVQLEPFTKARSSGFAMELEGAALPVDMREDEAERMVWRLLAALAGAALPGERLRLRLRRRDDRVRLTVRLPAALAARADAELFRAVTEDRGQALSAGMFGTGFALRLAIAEAESAGGTLIRKGDRLRLELPGLTATDTGHSDGDALARSAAGDGIAP
jgi:two-component system OmpR family sensor kinase